MGCTAAGVATVAIDFGSEWVKMAIVKVKGLQSLPPRGPGVPYLTGALLQRHSRAPPWTLS